MKGMFLFIGESFRYGTHGTRCRGDDNSYDEQIKASKRHIEFIEYIAEKYNITDISIHLTSYHTKFNDDLLAIYQKYLRHHHFYDHVIGLNALFQNSIDFMDTKEEYDFIFYIRIDLYLKSHFFEIFDPTIHMILYPTICWKHDSRCGDHPRINDMMLFVPNKYFSYLKNIIVGHETWTCLLNSTDLTYNDMDTMIHTYHDSDSAKDFNPLYFIVNRPESDIFHSDGHIFNKFAM
jgi:hypothetical protein